MRKLTVGHFVVDVLSPILSFFGALWLIWAFETSMMPVVTEFEVTGAVQQGDAVYVTGALNKQRNCELLALSLYATPPSGPKVLIEQYRKDVFGSDAGVGHQAWGPVKIVLPQNYKQFGSVDITALHRCHGLWLQPTFYGSFDMKRLDK